MSRYVALWLSHHIVSAQTMPILTLISALGNNALQLNLLKLILLDWNLFTQPAKQVREGCWGTEGDNLFAHAAAAGEDGHQHPDTANRGNAQPRPEGAATAP